MMKILFIILVFFIMDCVAFASPGDIVDSISTPCGCPTGLAYDGNYLWVADRKADSIYKIDPKTGSITKSIPTPGFWPMGLAWDGKYLWNTDLEEEAIYKIDPESEKVLCSIPTPCPSPRGLTWDGNSLWLSDDYEDKVYQVSIEDGTIISSFDAPSGSSTGLAYGRKYLWSADRLRDEIYMLKPDDGNVIIISDSISPYIQGLAWDGNYLWACDYETDKIYKIKIMDNNYYSLKDERKAEVEYTQEFRNYGPSVVNKLDFYLAIPQSLKNQVISDIEYNPEPDGFLTDECGQVVAHYQFTDISANKIIRASIRTRAKIYKIHYFIFPENVLALNKIPREIRDKYLTDGSKYRIHNSIIKNAVEEAVGKEKNPYWIMRRIFKYVIDHLKYERSRGWDAAPEILRRGTGSCSEYTFVFIAMCRAAGLPARFAGSVGIRGDDASLDMVFHRWAEVYLPNYGWIPVDPSGGDSKSPRRQAMALGILSNRHLITTLGGGSKYLGWDYNSRAEWEFKGKVKIHLEKIAEWEPVKEGKR
jgi:hypothetical protein